MQNNKKLSYLKEVLKNKPTEWLDLTTHRLDIYDEELAKSQFIEQFEILFKNNNATTLALSELPTAYDYIRLGHPLSCVLEWAIAKNNNLNPNNVISFSSKTAPILAILRKNLLDNKNTQIIYKDELPDFFDVALLKLVYGYKFELKQICDKAEDVYFEGSTIFISKDDEIGDLCIKLNVDFFITIHSQLGSILLVKGKQNESYVSEIQHVRRRETIAMTPENTVSAIKLLIKEPEENVEKSTLNKDKQTVLSLIKTITGSFSRPLVGSSGLSVQYAIMMGLIHDALEKHKGKNIKIIVPPNCYGGTNDQARRIAACVANVEVVDLLVDAGNDMVQSIDFILEKIAKEDGVPYIIAEIPTNPRVEVPDLIQLKAVLKAIRKTNTGAIAIEPVFVLDQTFCPNVRFLGKDNLFATVKTISYVSGSKFPSGGQCIAGYCVGNENTAGFMHKIEQHLKLCDNEATSFQYEILAKQLPSMNKRISDAYKNTREFVSFINAALPEAKINFVSEELAEQQFTPSVFSLDLPAKGDTEEEKEVYKRNLNLKLINLMITEIPNESKFCVSYGQLKGCYWTIPATSTQGTTKEGDKDYIVRVAVSPNLDLELHKKVFLKFVESI